MMPWIVPFLAAITLLLTTELDFPVPIMGDMRADAPSFQPVTMSGVRVAQSSSTLSESGGPNVVLPPSSTKLHEVWAFGGYGQVSARPRILRIKRAYSRACYRAMRQGMAEYRGRWLLPADVPWRFRESFRQLPATRKELKPASTAPGLRCMTWNASKALVYDELLLWAKPTAGRDSHPGDGMVFLGHMEHLGLALHSLGLQASFCSAADTCRYSSNRSDCHSNLGGRTPCACASFS